MKDEKHILGWIVFVAALLLAMMYLDSKGDLPKRFSENEMRRLIRDELRSDGGQ